MNTDNLSVGLPVDLTPDLDLFENLLQSLNQNPTSGGVTETLNSEIPAPGILVLLVVGNKKITNVE